MSQGMQQLSAARQQGNKTSVLQMQGHELWKEQVKDSPLEPPGENAALLTP